MWRPPPAARRIFLKSSLVARARGLLSADGMVPIWRRSVRHHSHDYVGPGAWLITINAAQALPLFGRVVNGQVSLSQVGLIVRDCWAAVPAHFPNVVADHFVVMPNHLHAVLVIRQRVCDAVERFGKPVSGSVSTIVRSFKSASTRQARLSAGERITLWGRGFHDRRLGDESALRAARRYIDHNPIRWAEPFRCRGGYASAATIRVIGIPR